MGFRRYKATVTYLPSALVPKRQSLKFTFEIVSSQPVKGVNDLAFLKALAQLPANSVIASVELREERQPSQAVAA